MFDSASELVSDKGQGNKFWLAQKSGILTWCALPVKDMKNVSKNNKKNQLEEERKKTGRGGSMVTHKTRIQEVPGSNSMASQPG